MHMMIRIKNKKLQGPILSILNIPVNTALAASKVSVHPSKCGSVAKNSKT
jgi:hypothetical protein